MNRRGFLSSLIAVPAAERMLPAPERQNISFKFTSDDLAIPEVREILGGKLFVAYKSSEDRLHCWDGIMK